MLDDVIHAGAEATLTWLATMKDPGIKELLDKAYGYAVFPDMGRASVVLGGARGHGEVFEQGKPIGFATLRQVTLGAQVGGQTFSEVVLFGSKDALESFKKGKVSFTANASVVLVKAGATGTSDFRAVVAKAYSRGGMLLEMSIGGQKFTFHEHLLAKQKEGRGEESEQMNSGERPAEASAEAGTEYDDVEAMEEEAPEAEIEAAPEEEVAPEYEAAQELEPEQGVEAAPGRDEGNDAVAGAEETPPGGDASAAPTTSPPSRPQGHNGPVEAAEAVAKPGGGIGGGIASSGRKLVRNVVLRGRGLMRMGRVLVPRLPRHRPTMLLGKPSHLLEKVRTKAIGLDNEATLGPILSSEVDAALRRMMAHDPGLKDLLDKAYGYAVFPLVGKATAALGVGFGRGETYERGKLIGYAAMAQLTLGVQLGGQTYDEVIVFENEGALERFKRGKIAFAMNASAVLVKAGAAATTNYSSGTAVFVHPEGGLMLELGLGGQKFVFKQKGLEAPEVQAPEVRAPAVQAPEVQAPEVQAPVEAPEREAVEAAPAEEVRQPEGASPEAKTVEAEAGRADEQKAEATEAARSASARVKTAVAEARRKAAGAGARTKATVGHTRAAVKRGIGTLTRRPRGGA
ncbi:MAG: hypothetical protein K0S65_3809 [Labilithrix sp.]|nr:hypothetical protein [Labilithrix sp.]